jgi:hypothetical protein
LPSRDSRLVEELTIVVHSVNNTNMEKNTTRSADAIDTAALDLVTRFTNEVQGALREDQLTQGNLAHNMGVPPGRLSQLLSGGENLTVRALAGVAFSLNRHLELTLVPNPAEEDNDAVQAFDTAE